MGRSLRTITLAVVAAVTLVGCGDPGVGAGPNGAGPDGGWRFVEGAGPDGEIAVVEALRPTLDVEGERWGGRVCNSYGATVEREGHTVVVRELMQTEMACLEDGAMEAEAAYLGAFGQVERWDLDGDELVLTGDRVELRYRAEPEVEDLPLEGTVWRLETVMESGGPDGVATSAAADATLTFDGELLTGNDGCNDYGGPYELDGGRLVTGAIDQTLIGCEGPAGDQGAAVMAVLQDDPSITLHGDTLELEASAGRTLIYRADGARP